MPVKSAPVGHKIGSEPEMVVKQSTSTYIATCMESCDYRLEPNMPAN